MRRSLVAIGCLVILMSGAQYGAAVWARQRAETGIERLLNAARADGKAIRPGFVGVDPIRGTVSLADVVTNAASDAGPQLPQVQIGRAVVEGLSEPEDGRVSARRIELSDVAVTVRLGPLPDQRITFKAPRIEIVDCSGPATLFDRFAAGTPLDLIRSSLAAFASTSIASVVIPEMSISVGTGSAPPEATSHGVEYNGAGIALQEIDRGHIRSARIDRLTLGLQADSPPSGNIAATTANIVVSDFDVAPIVAALDPAKPTGEDGYRRIYRMLTAGPYSVSVAGAARTRMDAVEVEELAIDPAKFSLGEIMRVLQAVPTIAGPSSPQQAQQVQWLFETLATLYEGVRIARAEGRGIALAAEPNNEIKIATFRIAGMDKGRIAEIAIEGLDSPSASPPVKIGRFALGGLGVSGLMRSVARLSIMHARPQSADLIPLLRLLESAELQDVAVPEGSTGKMIRIDAAKIAWGRFVGALPSRAHATLHMTTPIVMANEELARQIAEAGFSNATIALDVGLGWNESSRAFVLSPGTAQVTNFGAAEVKASLSDVSAAMFSADPTSILLASVMVGVGPLEIVVRDLGGINAAVGVLARQQQTTPEAARQALAQALTEPLSSLAAANPDFGGLTDAIGTFIKSPGSTLNIRFTPKGRIMLMQLAAQLQQDPAVAVANFNVEAAVSKQQ